MNTYLPEALEALEALDIRDIEMQAEYFVVLNPDGYCVLQGTFKAAWRTRKAAKRAAGMLGTGYLPLKQIKQ